MSYYEEYEEDFESYDDYQDFRDDYGIDDGYDDTSNSAESYGEESNMSAAQVGSTFTTGNSTVANLAEGTILTVVGPGKLEITEVPVAEFLPGDRIQTHHGDGTVVSLSSRFGALEGFDPETQVLYVADNSTVVRRIAKAGLVSAD